MKLRNVVLVALVLMLALVGVVQAQDTATDEPTVVFATNTVEAVTAEAVPTEAVVIVDPVEPTAIPGDGAGQDEPDGSINEQLPGYDSEFVQSIIDSALERYGQMSLAFIVVIGVIVVLALALLWNSLPQPLRGKMQADAITGLGKLEIAVDERLAAAGATPRPDDEIVYGFLARMIEEAQKRVPKTEGEPPAL